MVIKRSLKLSLDFGNTEKKEELDLLWEAYRQAESSEGIDWKALMHAVRILHEAHELLLYHQITFPRSESELLLRIRKGELPYQLVDEVIEMGEVKICPRALHSPGESGS